MVETAEREARVILTCDRLFVRRRLSDQTFLVQGLDKKEQLADVLAAFDLKVVSSDLLSTCAKCNGSFIPRWGRVPLSCCGSSIRDGQGRSVASGVATLYCRCFFSVVLSVDDCWVSVLFFSADRMVHSEAEIKCCLVRCGGRRFAGQ